MKPKYLVCPNHGVGQVRNPNLMKTIWGKPVPMVEIEIVGSGLTIILPKAKMKESGVRPVMAKTVARECERIIRTKARAPTKRWPTFYRECMVAIEANDPIAIANAQAKLLAIAGKRTLTFSENKMLSWIDLRLGSEIAIALGRPVVDAVNL